MFLSYCAPLPLPSLRLCVRVRPSVPGGNHFRCFLSVSVAVAPSSPSYSCLHIPDDEPVNHQ